MATFEVAESPVAFLRQVLRGADAAEPFAALHAIKEDVEHGTGGFADGDDEYALVLREIDDFRSAAIRDQAVEDIALKLKAAVEGRFNAAGLQGFQEEAGCACMEELKRGVACGCHWSCSLSQAASECCMDSRCPV